MRYRVDSALIEKRNRAIHNGYEKHDCKMFLERALASENKKSSSRKSDVLKFFTECSGPSNANVYYSDCFKLIEMENEVDPKFAKTLAEKFTDYILPYIENLDAVNETVDEYRIDPDIITKIDNATGSYKVCDRVLDNHSKISKRFNLESFIRTRRNKPLSNIILEGCKMIDTYGLKPHAKMNVCLEELSYILQKESIDYDKSELVKYVTEYFLTSQNNTDIIKDNYKMVLSENSMIEDTDLGSVSYFTGDTDTSKSYITRQLNGFSMSNDKNVKLYLTNMVNTIFAEDDTRKDFVYNTWKILDYVHDYLVSDVYNIDEVLSCLNRIPEKIEACSSNDNYFFTREDLDMIVSAYESAINKINYDIDSGVEGDELSKLVKLKDLYRETINRINVLRSTLYTSYNIESMKEMVAMTESSVPLYLNEFKVFKFQNLITASIAVAKEIAKRDKKSGKKANKKLTKVLNKGRKLLSLVSEDVICQDNTTDVMVQEYKILDNNDFYEVQDELTSFCKYCNETFLVPRQCKCYYTVLGETVQIHVRDDSYIIGLENTSVPEELLENAIELESLVEECETIDTDAMGNVVYEMMRHTDEIDYDRAKSIIEASQYVESIDKEDIANFAEEYMEYSTKTNEYYNRSSIKSSINEWSHIEAPLSIQMEACNIIYSLLESDEEKKEINDQKDKEKEDKEKFNNPVSSLRDKFSKDKHEENDKDKSKDKNEDKEKKNPFAGLNLNNIKLALKGLQVKLKDLNTKEQQFCKNMDMEASRLYKNCKDAMTSDRREAIIKGSVIPSFSKCIKWGIALCGIGVITANPAIPCIAAIGGMAVSKNLTRKERLLLLDDIDVELEVLNKEIEIAERNDQTKKLRRLLSMKKDLERQKQRIKYNIRVGKDMIVPGTASGTYKHV